MAERKCSRSDPPQERKRRILFADHRPGVGHATAFWRILRERPGDCEVIGYFSLDEAEGRAFAEANRLCYLEKLEEGQPVDGVIIPAASTPESHPELLEMALALGAPIFIDKPFAQSAAIACRMAGMARAAGVPVMSSSALRFAPETREAWQQHVNPRHVICWSGFSDRFDEFLIHPVELLAVFLGPTPECLESWREGDSHRLELAFAGGRKGTIFYLPCTQRYEFTVVEKGLWIHRTFMAKFPAIMMDRVLEFFRTAQPEPELEETCRIMHLLDVIRSLEPGDSREFPAWGGNANL